MVAIHLENEPAPEHLGCPDCDTDCVRPCGDGWFFCIHCRFSF